MKHDHYAAKKASSSAGKKAKQDTAASTLPVSSNTPSEVVEKEHQELLRMMNIDQLSPQSSKEVSQSNGLHPETKSLLSQTVMLSRLIKRIDEVQGQFHGRFQCSSQEDTN